MNSLDIHFFQTRINDLEQILDDLREMDGSPNYQLIFEVEKELEELQHKLDSVQVFYESSSGDDPV